MSCSQSDEKKPLPPGGMGLPVIGESIQFLMKGVEYYAEKIKEHGSIFKVNVLGSRGVRVAGADFVRSLVEREPTQLTMKWPKLVNEVLGKKAVVTVIGPEHTQLKAALIKAYSPERLSENMTVAENLFEEYFDEWVDKTKNKKPILGFKECENMTADLMLAVVLGCGREEDTGKRLQQAYNNISNNLFAVPIRFPFGGFDKALRARETISNFVETRIAAYEKEGSEKNKMGQMDLLMSLPGEGEDMAIDKEKVKDNVLGVMMAASSLAGGFTNLMFLLGTNPYVLEKVKEELKEFGLFGEGASAKLTYHILGKLEYVSSVVKESLRLRPPVGGCYRQAENQVDIDKYQIPSDWSVAYSIRDTHILTAKLLEDGDSFIPSRWMKRQGKPAGESSGEATALDPAKIEDSTSCHYMPFGSGPRMCLGYHFAKMVLCLFVVKLVTTLSWELKNPNSPVGYLPQTKPDDDMPAIFEKLK